MGLLPFRLDASTSHLVVQHSELLDYEKTPHYVFAIRATDTGYPDALSATATIIVNLVDVNEAPFFTPITLLEIKENTLPGEKIGQVSALDPDISSVVVHSLMNASDWVHMSPNGSLVSKKMFKYEQLPILYIQVSVEDDGRNCSVLESFNVNADKSICEKLTVSTVLTLSILNVNDPPRIVPSSFKILENLVAGLDFGTPLVVLDVDGPATKYTITSPVNALSDPAFGLANMSECFGINSNTGQLRALISFDYESQSLYSINVTYSDGEYITFTVIEVIIVNVNEAAYLVSNPQTGLVRENLAIGSVFMRTDIVDPDKDVIDMTRNHFILLDTTTPFAVHAETGEVYTTKVLDYEREISTYSLTIRVCDDIISTLCSDGYLRIDLIDVAETPLPPVVHCSIIENTMDLLSADLTSTCKLLAEDPDKNPSFSYKLVHGATDVQLFYLARDQMSYNDTGDASLQSTNQTWIELDARYYTTDSITVLVNQTAYRSDRNSSSMNAQVLNYEKKSVYSIPILVFDEYYSSNGLYSTGHIVITVRDANDCPTVGASVISFSVSEVDAHTQRTKRLQLGYPIPALDEDVEDILEYNLASPSNMSSSSLFAIDSRSGQLYLSRSPSNFEMIAPLVYDIVIIITDNGGSSGKTSSIVYTQRCSIVVPVRISVLRTNMPPMWLENMPSNFTIKENVPSGTPVEGNASSKLSNYAVDTQTLEYSLLSKENRYCENTFMVDLSTGEITLRPSNSLDYESNSLYYCTVAACDTFDSCSNTDFNIFIRDVNESPSFGSLTDASNVVFEIDEKNTENTTVDRCLGAHDPDRGDNSALQYSIRCINEYNCDSIFALRIEKDTALGNCARLILKETLDYENQPQLYFLALVVQDRNGLSSRLDIRVQIIDINELQWFGSFATTANVPENAAIDELLFKVTSKDPDILTASYSTMTYIITSIYPSGSDTSFRINASTGHIYLNGSLDYESIMEYEITIRVVDESKSPLAISTALRLTILDVEDTTIDDVTILSSDGETSASSSMLNTEGGEFLLARGTNIGFKQRMGSDVLIEDLTLQYTKYGSGVLYDAMNCSLVLGNTGVVCLSSPGAGNFLYWTVTLIMKVPRLGSVRFTATSSVPLLSYGAPIIHSVVCNYRFPTAHDAQNKNIVITGFNFGYVGISSQLIAVKYGNGAFTAKNCSLDGQDQTGFPQKQTLKCSSVQGSGQGFSFVVAISGQISNDFTPESESLCHYEAPTITSIISFGALSTIGGDQLRILGSGFGAATSSMHRVVSYFNSEHKFEITDCIVTTDHVELNCKTVPGCGNNFVWRIVVNNVSSEAYYPSDDTLHSYLAPRITSIRGFSSLSTIGGTRFLIEGADFGPDVALFRDPVLEFTSGHDTVYTPTNCKRLYMNKDLHNTIECISPAGTGANHLWRVTIENVTSAFLIQNTSYAGPIVTKVFRPNGTSVLQTSGNEEVIISGLNFGRKNSSIINSVTYGVMGTEFSASNCVIVVDNEWIVCNTIPGVGIRLSWAVTIDGLTSTNPTINYARPYITSIGGDGSINASAFGFQEIIIQGGNFGPSSIDLDAVTYGPTGREYKVERIIFHNDSTICCLSNPGTGMNLRWIVAVGGQSSLLSEAHTSYGTPSIDSISSLTASTNGTTYIHIRGHNFGANSTESGCKVVFTLPAEMQTFVKARTQILPILSWELYNKRLEILTVRIPAGFGLDGFISIQTGQFLGIYQQSEFFPISYDLPIIEQVYTDEGSPVCAPTCVTLTLLGSNFFTSGTLLISKTPVTMADLSSIKSQNLVSRTDQFIASWSHHSLVISDYVEKTGFVTILLGNRILSNSATFVWSCPTILDWYTLLANCDATNCTTSFHFTGDPSLYRDKPSSVAGRSTQQSATIGGATLNLYVKYLGSSSKVKVLVGSSAQCTNIQLTTPVLPPSKLLTTSGAGVTGITLLTCTVPAGQGSSQHLVVLRGSTPSAIRFIDYIPPRADWDLTNAYTAPTQGKVTTLVGTNFGTAPAVTLDSLGLQILSHSHTRLDVIIPAGEGGGHKLSLVVGDQVDETLFAYKAPVIYTYFTTGNSTEGGDEMRIKGENLGSQSLSDQHSVSFNDTYRCHIVSVAHNEIICRIGAGQGCDLPIVVNVSGLTNEETMRNATFSYDQPVLHNISQTSGPTHGYTCGCVSIPEKPCATQTAPFECNFQQIDSSIDKSKSHYCIKANISSVDAIYTQVAELLNVFSGDMPVYVGSDHRSLLLIRSFTTGKWKIMYDDVLLYQSAESSLAPPAHGWEDQSLMNSPYVEVIRGSCPDDTL
ncbi:hypothetical protein ABG067_001244 [Albugo candida]